MYRDRWEDILNAGGGATILGIQLDLNPAVIGGGPPMLSSWEGSSCDGDLHDQLVLESADFVACTLVLNYPEHTMGSCSDSGGLIVTVYADSACSTASRAVEFGASETKQLIAGGCTTGFDVAMSKTVYFRLTPNAADFVFPSCVGAGQTDIPTTTTGAGSLASGLHPVLADYLEALMNGSVKEEFKQFSWAMGPGIPHPRGLTGCSFLTSSEVMFIFGVSLCDVGNFNSIRMLCPVSCKCDYNPGPECPINCG
jgi:hypothetical protein